MARISQEPARLDLRGIVGSPFILTVTTATTDMSAVSVVCYDSAGAAIAAFAPTASIASPTTITITWTAAQTTAQAAGSVRYQLVATISGLAALPLLGGTFTLSPPGTANSSTSSTAALTVYVGSTLATLDVTVGGSASGSGANLAYTSSTTSGIVTSDTGTDATIPAATGSIGGLLTAAGFTKLSGIETAATADQTAAEILAALLTVDGAGSLLDADLLDGNSSAAFQPVATVLTNTTAAFTTAQESKLSGIETAADVTDATNVDAAGAVMNSDSSTAGMSFVIDEDNMATDSATKVPTQQSVKAYADLRLLKVAAGAAVEDLGAVESNVSTIAATGATETLDVSVYGVFDCTMDQACEFTFSNPAPSGKLSSFVLILRGAFTPTLPASVDWADATPLTHTTPSMFVFTTVDAGTTWLGARVGKAFG